MDGKEKFRETIISEERACCFVAVRLKIACNTAIDRKRSCRVVSGEENLPPNQKRKRGPAGPATEKIREKGGKRSGIKDIFFT